MTENTNSPAPASESALSRPLTLDDAAGIDFDEPEEANAEEEETTQSADATGEAEQGQETDEIETAEDGEVEDGEAGEETPKPSAEPTDDVHVTVNGEKVALSELKLGYMRQADYSRKTQEVASRRKGFDDMVGRVERSVNAVAQYLANQIPAAPDAQLAMTNPTEYVQRMAAHETAMAQVNTLLTQAAEVQQVVGALTTEQRTELMATENAKLRDAFPQTSTAEGRKAFFEAAATAAKSIGYTDEEIGHAMDHRLFALAHYAGIGLQAMKAREKAKAKTQNVPPVVPPKARQQGNQASARRNQEGMKRLAKTGSIDDALNIDWV